MKMKIFLFFLAIIISVFSLIACGGGGGGGDDPDPPAPVDTPWLCFTASADSTVSTNTKTDGTVSSVAPVLEYSKDDGTTWTDFELSYYDLGDNLITAGTTVALASGEKMYIRAKGTNASFSDYVSGSDFRVTSFLLTGAIAASGNIMSLVDKNCESKTIPNNGCFFNLFFNCTRLTSAPELPATTLTEMCYLSMFANCTSLTAAPVLPAKTLAYGCYAEMFANCTSITAAPELPATNLALSCYFAMFNGCTSLIAAPELPATTLAVDCYEGMFANCSALTSVPTLPATTLEEFCYNGMFDNCTSLVNAPEIKATTLANSSCYGMFIRCAALTKITVHFTDWNTAGHATENWVTDVATAGDFYCPAGLDTSVAGPNKNPAGWTVHNIP